MVYNFNKVYPYALLAKDMESQVERHISENQLRRRKKEVYINRLQKELLDAYKQPLKNMTISQGKLLIRLVDREIGKAPYSVIKEYKNGLSAGFWQGVAKIFGQDLTTHYDPKGEDKMTEYLVEKWQRGEFDALYYSIFWEMPKHPDIVWPSASARDGQRRAASRRVVNMSSKEPGSRSTSSPWTFRRRGMWTISSSVTST